ncbi:MAG: hypothetical protein WCP28_21815, partial [Actinomycetes bacterium]
WAGGASDPLMAWCTDTTNAVTTNTGIGDGAENTTAMLTNASPFAACTSGAGYSARAYHGGGLTDWYLPSRDDLDQMYLTQATIGGIGGAYWSSSQDDSATNAWKVGMAADQHFSNLKGDTGRVRPIRAF